MFRSLLVITVIFGLPENTLGQQMIYGKVTDGNSHQPLAYVNVFVNNTTLGTVTDEKGQYSLVIPKGAYEIVFSFVGYQSHEDKTLPESGDSLRIDVELFASSRQLESVTIYSNADKQWAKLFEQFKRSFLGNTEAADHCTILNAWCLELKRAKISGKRVLTAAPSQPLEVENLALGYKVLYDLHSFYASKESSRFSGNVYFIELQPADSAQEKFWARNRLRAYLGSSRHLFKSILDQRSKEEGFTLYIYETSLNKVQRTAYVPESIEYDSLKGSYKIPIIASTAVHYQSPFAPNTTLVAGLNVTNGYAEVDNHGVLVDPMSVMATGYMIESRVADFLPTDYKPTKVRSVDLNRESSLGVDMFVRKNEKSDSVMKNNSKIVTALARRDSLKEEVNHFFEYRPTEKIYIQFDKPFYLVGEDSWYKAYVLRSSDLSPTDISTVLYVDWIDPSGKIVKHQRLKIEAGAAVGNFTIDNGLPQGAYTVRAYTSWMRNEDPEFFYSRRIQIINPVTTSQGAPKDTGISKIDLQFFPEGGTFVAGMPARLAFKAIDRYGKGLDIEGKIVDQENELVTAFKSGHRGMGVVSFVPDIKQSYRAILESGEVFALPMPATRGLTLAASNTSNDVIFVRIQATQNYQSYVYLIGQSRGSIYLAECIMMDGLSKDISISKDGLPEGVLELSLLNGDGIPECSRMLFVKKDNHGDVRMITDKQNYGPRDSVTLNFKVSDSDGNPVETLLSVSVTDAGLVGPNIDSENIYTRLLLQSDIRGNIEDPRWYFSSESTDRKYALDLVMLTHGWSRYNWQRILDRGPLDSIVFKAERGIALEGKILTNNRPVKNSPFLLTIAEAGDDFVGVYETDSLGRFIVDHLDFSDSTLISWRVTKGKGVVQNAEIQLMEGNEVLPVPDHNSAVPAETEGERVFYEKLVERFQKTGVWSLSNSKVLDEVTIQSTRIKTRSVGMNRVVVKPGPEDLNMATAQFVGRYALKPPKVIVINGYPAEESDAFTILNRIPMKSIKSVTVSGTPRGGYSVAIRTNTSFADDDVGTVKKIVNGYDSIREFYHPKYGPSDVASSLPDYRMTLYWNANLPTDKDGIATVKFYNSDVAKQFLITVEGVENGVTISSSKIVGNVNEK